MTSDELTEEEWQRAGDEFAATLPPVKEELNRAPTKVEIYVQAHFRAAKKAAPKPSGKYNPLTRRRY